MVIYRLQWIISTLFCFVFPMSTNPDDDDDDYDQV